MTKPSFSRREFLKLAGLGAGALALRPLSKSALNPHRHPLLRRKYDFPQADHLGRVTEETGVHVRTEPSYLAPEATSLDGDTVVEQIREVVGVGPEGSRNFKWVETPQGYVWSALLQPVKNLPNTPVPSVPDYGSGPGMWVEVTQPYVEVQLANALPLGFRVKFLVENFKPIRFYYGEVLWVDDLRTTDAGVEYHLNELYGSRGDHFWGPAEGFKPVTPEDIAPISPDVQNKKIVINIARQTLSCYEEEKEVFFCRVSTGRYGEGTETPISDYLTTYMKYFSTHMEGGSAGGGYDLLGIGWCTFIATGGVAVHTCYWHNNFGERMSAGCVNASPENAKYVFRWSNPNIPYFPGKMDSIPDGTRVMVVAA